MVVIQHGNGGEMTTNLSGNSVSRVYSDDRYHWKEQPKFLCDNEWYALNVLRNSGYVPDANRVSDTIIQMDTIVTEPITDEVLFRDLCYVFIKYLKGHLIRHGDLTTPHVFVVKNSPVVIDWAESRFLNDPRPDKRREGDEYWMEQTIENLLSIQRTGT